MKKTKLTVTARGKTKEDLVQALEQVIRDLREGYLSGSNCSDDGEYSFDVTGEIP